MTVISVYYECNAAHASLSDKKKAMLRDFEVVKVIWKYAAVAMACVYIFVFIIFV